MCSSSFWVYINPICLHCIFTVMRTEPQAWHMLSKWHSRQATSQLSTEYWILLSFFYVYGHFNSMYVCASWGRQQRASGPLTGVTDAHRVLCGCQDLNPCPSGRAASLFCCYSEFNHWADSNPSMEYWNYTKGLGEERVDLPLPKSPEKYNLI